MSTTTQQAFDRAVLRSSLNNTDLYPIANAISTMSFYEAQAMATAAVANPDYFGTEGTTNTRVTYDEEWVLSSAPGNIGIITKATIDTIVGTVADVSEDDEIDIVNIAYPEHGVIPRCYIRNNRLYGIEDDLGADSSNMVTVVKLWYTAMPTPLSTAESILTVPDMWTHLVITPLAAEMALADQRGEDYDRLIQEYQRDIQSFALFVQAHNYTSRQGFGYHQVQGV